MPEKSTRPWLSRGTGPAEAAPRPAPRAPCGAAAPRCCCAIISAGTENASNTTRITTKPDARYLTLHSTSILRGPTRSGSGSRFHFRAIGEREHPRMCCVPAGSGHPAHHGHRIPDLREHFVAGPAFGTPHQHVGRVTFEGPSGNSTGRILHVDRVIDVRIAPVHGFQHAGYRDGLTPVVLRRERMVRQHGNYCYQ